MEYPVQHRFLQLDGVEVFYREAGRRGAPVVLLPHGYPASSYQFRNLLPALSDEWHLVAPDFPGFGYSATPESFDYSFAGYTDFLEAFTGALRLERFALYLQDYGSQIGLRLAMRQPRRISALIVQNGDIYEDALGPKYAALLAYFEQRTPELKQKLLDSINEEGFKDEFLNEVPPDTALRIPPDLWKLHWPLMNTPKRREICFQLMEGLDENRGWFSRYQAWLRQHQPPALIAWGPQDGFMPEDSARAWLRDLPSAEFHLLDGGHWLLETHLDAMVGLIRGFLARHR